MSIALFIRIIYWSHKLSHLYILSLLSFPLSQRFTHTLRVAKESAQRGRARVPPLIESSISISRLLNSSTPTMAQKQMHYIYVYTQKLTRQKQINYKTRAERGENEFKITDSAKLWIVTPFFICRLELSSYKRNFPRAKCVFKFCPLFSVVRGRSISPVCRETDRERETEPERVSIIFYQTKKKTCRREKEIENFHRCRAIIWWLSRLRLFLALRRTCQKLRHEYNAYTDTVLCDVGSRWCVLLSLF